MIEGPARQLKAVIDAAGNELIAPLADIDQQLAEANERLAETDIDSDEATSILYGMVCLEAARMMAEDKLNARKNA